MGRDHLGGFLGIEAEDPLGCGGVGKSETGKGMDPGGSSRQALLSRLAEKAVRAFQSLSQSPLGSAIHIGSSLDPLSCFPGHSTLELPYFSQFGAESYK